MLLLFLHLWTFHQTLTSGPGVLELKAPPPFRSNVSSVRTQCLRMQGDLVCLRVVSGVDAFVIGSWELSTDVSEQLIGHVFEGKVVQLVTFKEVL